MASDVELRTAYEEWTETVKRSDSIEVMRFCPGRSYVELKMPDTVANIEQVKIVPVSHNQGIAPSMYL